MDTLFTNLDMIAPTFFSLLSVLLFRKHTRWLCYITVLLAIGAELIPLSVNFIGLSACVACLGALIIGDVLRSYHISHPFLRLRMLGIKRLTS